MLGVKVKTITGLRINWLMILMFIINIKTINGCSDINCLICETSTICSGCMIGYGLSAGIGSQCTPCQAYCFDCSTNSNECRVCDFGYGVSSGRVCIPCVDNNCIVCSYNANIC